MKKKIGMMIFAAAIVLAFSAPVLAKAVTYLYDVYYITYDCSVSSTKGTSYTSGETDPYYNYTCLVVYNNSESKGSDFVWKTNNETAKAKVSGKSGLTRAKSLHAVTDKNHNTLLSSRYTRVRYTSK